MKRGCRRLMVDVDTASGSIPPAPGRDAARRQRGTTTACAWCGKAVEQPARGRRRRYCSQACRQRAYEQRHHMERGGIPTDAVVLGSEEAQSLFDRWYQVRCTVEDLSMVLDGFSATDDSDIDEVRDIVAELRTLTAEAEGWRRHDGA